MPDRLIHIQSTRPAPHPPAHVRLRWLAGVISGITSGLLAGWFMMG